jgi:hypothetical protein
LLKWRAAEERCDDISTVRKARLEATDYTPLPADFPHRVELSGFGYVGAEDVAGAEVDEFLALGFTLRQSDEIVAAAEVL